MKKNKINPKLNQLINLLIKNKLTIATCESASCGLLASTFGDIPGVSQTYLGGLVTYSNEAKVILANVRYQDINQYSAISEQVAKQMALNSAKLLNANIGISITGNAGPSASENKSVGLFYIGISIFAKVDYYEVALDPQYSRNQMREIIVQKAIDTLYDLLSIVK